MAKPPEPIEEVLPAAEAAVIAEVTRVVQQSPQQSYPQSQETSLPTTAARQVVELKVSKVLFGSLATAGALVQAVKPEGAYALRAGNHGPFVLTKSDAGVEILGRYGPDTWPEAAVQQAARRLGKV
jgi:hypothetical protein